MSDWKLKVFKQAYGTAKTKGEEQFMFEDMVFLTTYAGYLIEFLNQKIGVGR